MYWVYVIENPHGKLYKGYTNNIVLRICEHNAGRVASYTRGRGPWKLVYSEEWRSKIEAVAREKFLKSGKGREFLRKHILLSASQTLPE
ncbi:MAG: GIY-YIG nuclease family protein [Candidatus Doudnabacteria bacterium]|nr:GIY-YIG nuclease family protein [Candidatus Doudnabacteria bacterium]